MQDIITTLQQELQQLSKITKKADASLKKAPNGILRISQSNGVPQYYIRQTPQDKNGTYLKKEQLPLARLLAQKQYDTLVLKQAHQREKLIRNFLNNYPKTSLDDIYLNASVPRQKLINPCIPTEEQFIENWCKKDYTTKTFSEDTPEIYTEKGERVRSKSEKILADKFYIMGIPYHYERPLVLKNFGTIYPDFLLLNKRTRLEYYLEHLGLMDDSHYVEKALLKLETYAANGIFPGKNLLITHETKNHPLNIKAVEALISEFLM